MDKLKGGKMYKKQDGYGMVELMAIVVIGLLITIPVGMWTDRNLEFYLSLIKKTAVHVPFIVSWIITVLLKGVALVANIILELIRMVL
jgi:hypothetical protein